MSKLDPASMSHLRWTGADSWPEDVRSALLGPGAPFELAKEQVLGYEHDVFVRRPRSLRQLLDECSSGHEHLTWLVGPERSWTFGEAIADIDKTAALLRQRYGIVAGDRVAIVSANSAEYAIAMWAVVTTGGIVTSLNGWWTGAELAYGIELTTPSLILGDERRLKRLDSAALPQDVPVRLLNDLVEEAGSSGGRVSFDDDLPEDTPAVIIFTSGTTGRPKGATLSHRNILNFASTTLLSIAMAEAFTPVSAAERPQGASILTAPMFHNSGMLGTFMIGPVTRGKMIFMRPGKWDPTEYLRLSALHQVSTWNGVPTQFWRLLNHPDFETFDLSALRVIGSGGAMFRPELVRELGRRLPGIHLGNGYGMSEGAGLGTITGGDLMVGTPEAVGSVQPTVELEVRGVDDAVLPEGDVGEICLRTPSIFLGYWTDPAATEAVLDENRWYRTGDFGKVVNGLLVLEGRRHDLIVRAGENIYPAEIETRLTDHPEIDDAAVLGVDHAELGQEVKAVIVRRAGSNISADAIRGWCATTLAGFKVPAHVEFRDFLPYSLTGKLQKNELERESENSTHARAVTIP